MVNVYVMIRDLYGFMNLTESISAIALQENILVLVGVYLVLTEHGKMEVVIALEVEIGNGRAVGDVDVG